MKKLISIIVPIYNVESYLKKCINSILVQTYSNIEIILVDDGSTDNCGKICDDYLQIDDRIKVIHKINGGLSDARNTGLEKSKGEYILFVDSDDYIDSNMCNVLLYIAEKYNADIVSCNFQEIYPNGRRIINKQSINKLEILSGLDAIYKYFFQYTVDMNVVWNKLYRKNIFLEKEKIYFPVGLLHEDNFIIYKLYYYAKKIVVTNEVLYNYLKREGSITNKYSAKNIMDKIAGQIEQYSFSKDKNKKLKEMVQSVNINMYAYFFYSYYKNFNGHKKLKTKLKEYRKIILSNNINIINNPYITIKIFIKYCLIKFHLIFLYKFLYDIYKKK